MLLFYHGLFRLRNLFYWLVPVTKRNKITFISCTFLLLLFNLSLFMAFRAGNTLLRKLLKMNYFSWRLRKYFLYNHTTYFGDNRQHYNWDRLFIIQPYYTRISRITLVTFCTSYAVNYSPVAKCTLMSTRTFQLLLIISRTGCANYN